MIRTGTTSVTAEPAVAAVIELLEAGATETTSETAEPAVAAVVETLEAEELRAVIKADAEEAEAER